MWKGCNADEIFYFKGKPVTLYTQKACQPIVATVVRDSATNDNNNNGMVTFPNAKINIGLDILRKRADGYHDISTVMIPVPWCDVLEIVTAQKSADSLSVSGREVDCPPEKNLVMKAVSAMRSEFYFPHVDVYLHKIIPDGAGLGGGSADAAFTLMALNELFALGCGKERLADIAAGIGADCPFFIYNKPMLCEGTGTDMRPYGLCLPDGLCVAIVKPPMSVPTAQAYASVIPRVPSESLEVLLERGPVSNWQGVITNDFEQSVFGIFPDVKAIKDELLNAGAVYASMSGSGSAVYGLFNENDIMAEQLKQRFVDCDIFVGPLHV